MPVLQEDVIATRPNLMRLALVAILVSLPLPLLAFSPWALGPAAMLAAIWLSLEVWGQLPIGAPLRVSPEGFCFGCCASLSEVSWQQVVPGSFRVHPFDRVGSTPHLTWESASPRTFPRWKRVLNHLLYGAAHVLPDVRYAQSLEHIAGLLNSASLTACGATAVGRAGPPVQNPRRAKTVLIVVLHLLLIIALAIEVFAF